MKLKIPTLVILFFLVACNQTIDKEAIKKEIAEAEQAFNDHAKMHGLKSAFAEYAHPEAVINRGDSIIKGQAAIRNYFDSQSYLEVELTWSPSFIDVSNSGDLGYTYGTYHFKGIQVDSSQIDATGIFHTVWKRDEKGGWKYVYD